MRKKPLLAVAVCTAALTGASASAAFASEVIGPPGSLTPNEAALSHANSICVFSGLNDNPGSTNPEDPGGIVQSYGFSFVSKGLKAVVPSPGATVEDGGCRGGGIRLTPAPASGPTFIHPKPRRLARTGSPPPPSGVRQPSGVSRLATR